VEITAKKQSLKLRDLERHSPRAKFPEGRGWELNDQDTLESSNAEERRNKG